jgi:F-type H+-transporting ATPase subunit delta
MPSALATHYAHALADAVFASDSGIAPQDAVAQFRAAESFLSGSQDLIKVLLSPAVPKPQKQSAVSKLAEEMGLHRVIRNFLLVVISHRRIGDLKAMRESFEDIVDERLGWMKADIASARELSPDQRQQIERALGTKLGKLIRANYTVEPPLIGGVRARVASKEYDATIRGKLEGLRQRLATIL